MEKIKWLFGSTEDGSNQGDPILVLDTPETRDDAKLETMGVEADGWFSQFLVTYEARIRHSNDSTTHLGTANSGWLLAEDYMDGGGRSPPVEMSVSGLSLSLGDRLEIVVTLEEDLYSDIDTKTFISPQLNSYARVAAGTWTFSFFYRMDMTLDLYCGVKDNPAEGDYRSHSFIDNVSIESEGVPTPSLAAEQIGSIIRLTVTPGV